jgi:multidrug efflux pump subunit AcrA (membrane-fusion protein)
VDAYVDETDIGKVALGQSVTVTVDAFPGQSFSGRVTKIASGSTIIQAVITYDVTAALDANNKNSLKPDMTASVTIQTGTRSGALLVPSEAIKTSTKGVTVNVLNKAKTATEARKVTLGGTDGVNTEIS